MIFTPTKDTFRISDIDMCGTSIPDPVGGSVDGAMGWCKSRPGTRVAPATAPDSYDCSCVGVGAMPFTPGTPGTSGDCVFTLECIDLSSATLTVADMLLGPFKARMSQKPHEFEQSAEYNSGDTENLDHISVS